ncbi:hypothetical protein HAT91_03002 [Dickeya solani]|nr:hypothetical protein HAT91_03002 [Dickeya solani]
MSRLIRTTIPIRTTTTTNIATVMILSTRILTVMHIRMNTITMDITMNMIITMSMTTRQPRPA